MTTEDTQPLPSESACCDPADDGACCPPSGAEPRIPEDDATATREFAALAKALGHPARLTIVRLLIERDECIAGDIVNELPLAQSTVSQHLKQLKSAGLVRGEIDGPRVCYCIEPAAIALLKKYVEAL